LAAFLSFLAIQHAAAHTPSMFWNVKN